MQTETSAKVKHKLSKANNISKTKKHMDVYISIYTGFLKLLFS